MKLRQDMTQMRDDMDASVQRRIEEMRAEVEHQMRAEMEANVQRQIASQMADYFARMGPRPPPPT